MRSVAVYFTERTASKQPLEEAEAIQHAQTASVPRSMNGEEPTNGHSVYYDAKGATGGAYTNGSYHYSGYQ